MAPEGLAPVGAAGVDVVFVDEAPTVCSRVMRRVGRWRRASELRGKEGRWWPRSRVEGALCSAVWIGQGLRGEDEVSNVSSQSYRLLRRFDVGFRVDFRWIA